MSEAGSVAGGLLLDTSVVIDFMRGDLSLQERLLSSGTIYIPLVVLGELLFGAEKASNRVKTLSQIRTFMRASNLLRPDEVTAGEYAILKAELARKGKPIPDNDVWIAAAALQHGLPLVTRDAHFNYVPRVQTLNS